MFTGFAPPTSEVYTDLPASARGAVALVRPVLAQGGPPRAVALLLEVTARDNAAALLAPTLLVGAGMLGAGVGVARTHSPGDAIAAELLAGRYQPVPQNQPRWDSAGRLLVREGRSNGIRNPRAVGLGTGTPGTAPTHWTLAGTTGGITQTVVGVGREDEIEYFDIRFAGTASNTASGRVLIAFEQAGIAAAAPGEVWTASEFMALVSGSILGAVTFSRSILAHTAALGLAGGTYPSSNPPAVSLAAARYVRSYTMPATTASVRSLLQGSWASGTVMDFTLRVGWPQIERGATVTAPILPAAGGIAASTRGVDVPIWTPGGGWPARGALLVDLLLDALPASTAGILQADDTSDSNRIVARIGSGGAVEVLAVSGGVTTATLSPAGALAAGVPARVLVGWSPTGLLVATSAGDLLRATVARPAGLIRAVLGHANAAGTAPLNGTLLADSFDFMPTDAEARRIVTF